MMDEIINFLGSSASVGSGAIAGAFIIIKFVQNAFKEISIELKEVCNKLDMIIKSYEVTKVKNEVELDHIKLRLIEIDKRITKLEEKQ